MYLLYFDESGNTGKNGSDFFIVSCISIHEAQWAESYEKALSFRRELNQKHFKQIGGLKELHTIDFLRNSGSKIRTLKLSDQQRVDIITSVCEFISTLNIEVHNHVILKHKGFSRLDSRIFKKTVFREIIAHSLEDVYQAMSAAGFIERLLLVADSEGVARSMRQTLTAIRANVSHDQGKKALDYTLMNPFYRDSRDSHFIQFADLVATVIHFHSSYEVELENPKSKIDNFITRNVVDTWLQKLEPVFYKSGLGDEYGVVYHEDEGK